jgi:hypothetical protein
MRLTASSAHVGGTAPMTASHAWAPYKSICSRYDTSGYVFFVSGLAIYQASISMQLQE